MLIKLTPNWKENKNIIIFWSTIVLSKFQSHWGDQSEYFWENKLFHVNQRKKAPESGSKREEIKKKLKVAHPKGLEAKEKSNCKFRVSEVWYMFVASFLPVMRKMV